MSSKQDDKILREKFKKIKKRQNIALIFIGILYAVLFFVFINFEDDIGQLSRQAEFGIVAIMLAPIVFIVINWRCPKCGVFLGRKFVDRCRGCGFKLK